MPHVMVGPCADFRRQAQPRCALREREAIKGADAAFGVAQEGLHRCQGGDMGDGSTVVCMWDT